MARKKVVCPRSNSHFCMGHFLINHGGWWVPNLEPYPVGLKPTNMIRWHHLVFLWGAKTLNSSWYSQCRHMWKMLCRHVSHGILHQTQRFVADLSFVLVSWGYLKMAVQPPARSPCHQGNCWLKSGSSLECRLHTYNTEPGTTMKLFLSFAASWKYRVGQPIVLNSH